MEEPTVRHRATTHVSNLKTGLRHAGVQRIFLNAVRTGAVNALAAATSEVLNYYLESRGLNSRRITLLVVPNPDKGHAENPLKRRF